ncbi:MAG: tRNA-dihydrouridine synthase family protein [Lachnospiraceae bacterium]|nr:tRNA-dihydrouridine synthase family protein [Lachnospiraceae bacterium]
MKFYLAPMEGITTYIYRNALHHHYGGFDCYYTPFMSNTVLSSKELRDISPENNKDMKVVPQILTNRAETFIAIAEKLHTCGYEEVNFNLGCPSGTVAAKKRGAGFLSVPDELDHFLEEIFAKCPLDISIKTRIGIESEYEWEDLLVIYKKYPIKELIIHPRYQKEFYKGTPHVEAFKQTADILKDSSIALCYNGDITSAKRFCDLIKKVPSTEAVMLGRGVLANPELGRILRNKESELLLSDKLSRFKAFHDEILTGYMDYMSGDQPVLFKMKELWSYMGPYVHASDSLLKKIRKAKRISDYQSTVQIILLEAQRI